MKAKLYSKTLQPREKSTPNTCNKIRTKFAGFDKMCSSWSTCKEQYKPMFSNINFDILQLKIMTIRTINEIKQWFLFCFYEMRLIKPPQSPHMRKAQLKELPLLYSGPAFDISNCVCWESGFHIAILSSLRSCGRW